MDNKANQKIVYGAGEGYPSNGAAAGCKAGPSNHGRPGVGRQIPGHVHASGEEDTRTRVVSEKIGGTRRYEHSPGTFVGRDTAEMRRRRGERVRFDDEMSLCSSSSAVAGALDKRSYRKIAGPLSIAAGTIIVEVLVGWSPALPRRFPQKRPGVRADFLHVNKKKKVYCTFLQITEKAGNYIMGETRYLPNRNYIRNNT